MGAETGQQATGNPCPNWLCLNFHTPAQDFQPGPEMPLQGISPPRRAPYKRGRSRPRGRPRAGCWPPVNSMEPVTSGMSVVNDSLPDSPCLETIQGSIYDWPRYYEFVFGSDWAAEVHFLNRCFENYLSGPDVRQSAARLFEPACGTGRLLFRLARQGYQVSGLDINQAAVDYCNRRLARNGFGETAFWGDMCDFRLPKPCDAAFNTINSFRHLDTDARAIDHLKCMASAIRPGGIYVLGLHLTPTAVEPDDCESWSHRRGHLQINTSMWLLERDLNKRLERHAMVFDVYTPSRQFRIRDELGFRTYTVGQFLKLLGTVPEFRTADVFDFAYDVQSPLELDDTTQDAVFILQRQ